MARPLTGMKLLPAAVVVAAVAFCACSESKQESIRIGADPEKFPTLKTLDVDSYISDSSYTRYRITAPVWLMFEEAKGPYWSFPEGLYALRFDNSMNENGSFTADSATYLSKKRIWRFDRNVRMLNVDGDKFLTQQLFWDQAQAKLYSDSFIHIERADRIIEGYGFESNQDMTEYIIRRPTGIFPTRDFVGGDRPAAPADGPTPPPATAPLPAAAAQAPQAQN